MAAAMVARNILEHGLSRNELLNVNVPALLPEECKGIETTRQGKRVYQDELIRRIDPRGIPYYWIGGPAPSGIDTPGTDFSAIVNGKIAVTPIHLDLTARTLLKRIRAWEWRLEPSLPAATESALQAPTREERPLEAARDEELTEEATRERR
jgi:5'-nucleotidase